MYEFQSKPSTKQFKSDGAQNPLLVITLETNKIENKTQQQQQQQKKR